MRARWTAAIGVVVLGLIVPAAVSAYSSGTYGSGAYGSCVYGSVCSITLTSSGTINLNITPASGGRCTIQSDTASVLTDDTNGYTLTLADTTTNTSLISGGNTIPATSGSSSSPATLVPNAWGWRIDGLGTFGAGPTTAQSNIIPSSALFAAIKSSSGTADTIAATSVAANPAVATTIWYGACANTSLTSGSYSSQVTYTALAN